ncbi:Smr/MutS family protein [candidate division KSB1 bacterium]|nr:Smr/MutS family protein [candidate division KSB1 bacterium]
MGGRLDLGRPDLDTDRQLFFDSPGRQRPPARAAIVVARRLADYRRACDAQIYHDLDYNIRHLQDWATALDVRHSVRDDGYAQAAFDDLGVTVHGIAILDGYRTPTKVRVLGGGKHAIKQQKDRILEELDELDETGFEDKPSTSFTLANGMDVLWKTQNKVGTIIKIQEGEEKVLLQVGSMNFWVPRRELAPAPETKARQPARASVRIDTAPKSDVLPEIDVRGHLLDEAVEKVDKFLDDAVLAGWGEVRIIHGKGTGALRRGLADFLETHARVKNKKIGAWNEGDLGVTIVELH